MIRFLENTKKLALLLSVVSLSCVSQNIKTIKSEFYPEYCSSKIDAKEYYRERMLQRNILVLRKKVRPEKKTEVLVDVAIAGDVDFFLIEAEKRNVDLERLLDLDFIAYDYVHAKSSFEMILGFQKSESNRGDYIVINSHSGMCPDKRRMVVIHELTHHLRDDGFHCEDTRCSLIMSASVGSSVVEKINSNLKEELDKLFDNIKRIQERK